MSESQAKPSRRGFMLGAAAATAAGASAVAVQQRAAQPLPEPEDAPPKPERGGGYRVSEHVLRYYRTTRV